MKIAITADPEIPVPPLYYGGIERIIGMLIKSYVDMGHEVTLFAHEDSITPATLIPYQGKTSNKFSDIIKNSTLINRHLFTKKYDIIHSFGRLLYIFPQLPRAIPKLMSYQREPTISQIKKAIKLTAKHTLTFTGCSAYISKQILPFAPAYPIFNGVDLGIYNFRAEVGADAPLVFLGRIDPIKGTHIAINVALATRKKLLIAGNIPVEYQTYFDEQIKTMLNEQIMYVGPVNDEQKNRLLGQALAFLMPITWDEPFGIVMAEAMACGTPVIALNRGAVPEVVINGYNGYRCDTAEEMIGYVEQIQNIDRNNVRHDAERRFSANVIAEQYLKLYDDLING